MGRDSDDIHRNFNSSSERNSDNVGEKLFSFSIDFDVVFLTWIYIYEVGRKMHQDGRED